MRATDEIRFRALREGVFAYAARVPAGGFQWRDDVPPSSYSGAAPPFLVGPVPVGVEFLESIDPLFRQKGKPTRIHRTFGDLGDSPEQILAFANRYGALGQGAVNLEERILQPQSGPVHKYAVRLFDGEPLAAWRVEIAAMARLLALWDAVRLNDLPTLASVVEWRDKPRRVFIHPEGRARPVWSKLADEHDLPGHDRHLLDRWQPGDTREPARYYVHVQVNRRLKGHVSPVVLPYAEEGSRIAHFPDSLLAALYVLFALELAQEKPAAVCAYEDCPYGRTFTPTRTNQQYCHEQCKRNASYHRVKKGGTTND